MNYAPTFARSVSAELKKITSLRSSWITAAIAIIATSGIHALTMFGVRDSLRYLGPEQAIDAPLSAVSTTILAPILILFTLTVGTTVMTAEYSHKTIYQSLLSNGSRLGFYVAKGVGITLWWMTVALINLLIIIGVTYLVLSDVGAKFYDLGNGGTLMTWVAYLLVVWFVLLMSLGVATWLRSTAGATTMMVGLLFLLQIIVAMPVELFRNIGPYMPFNLITAATMPRDTSGFGADFFADGTLTVGPNEALVWLALWTAGFLALGAWRLQARDA